MKKEYSSIFRSIGSSGNTLWGDGFTVYVRCPYCGEWFHATKELTEYIKSITSQERDERLGQ